MFIVSPGRLRSIGTQKELASLLGIELKQLIYWAYIASTEDKYHTFSIPKKAGGERIIIAPNDYLKGIMRRLLQLLEEIYEPKSLVHGFLKDKSILSNAREHSNKKYVLNFDLDNFFPSIGFPRIRGLLLARPYSLTDAVATTIAQLCCCDGALPQGAPTSPILANMICGRLDRDLKLFFRTYKCVYTRYADDITVSTTVSKFPVEIALLKSPPNGTDAQLSDQLSLIIKNNGFKVNEAKTRLQDRRHRQVVTGLITNRFPNVRRSFVNEIRSLIHIWMRFGIGEAKKSYETKRSLSSSISEEQFKKAIVGRLNYLGMIRGKNNGIYVSLVKKLRLLDSKLIREPIDYTEAAAKATWVVETDLEAKPEPSQHAQGSAVMLEHIGLVTCAHVCIEPLVAYQPSAPAKRYPVTILKRNEHLDLAILSIEAPKAIALKIGKLASIGIGSPITLMGFPQHDLGNEINIQTGQVIQRKVLHGVRYFLISAPIVSGASGSPVIDAKGEVVGIASRGEKTHNQAADDHAVQYGVIFVDQLANI